MKRKISLLALLLTLILVSSCAKNNPFSVNDTTNNNDSSIQFLQKVMEVFTIF